MTRSMMSRKDGKMKHEWKTDKRKMINTNGRTDERKTINNSRKWTDRGKIL